MVPFCCATYSRPSGPNCREVGLTEDAFLSKLLPKLIGVACWASEGPARSITFASTTAATSARMYKTPVGAIAPSGRPSNLECLVISEPMLCFLLTPIPPIPVVGLEPIDEDRRGSQPPYWRSVFTLVN